MPEPALELKKLEYLLGDWTLEGKVKPGPMGPGGQFTMTEHNYWMDGGFFLVIESEFKGGGMPGGTGTAYLGFDPEKKLYTYHEFNSIGEFQHSTGSVEGDTWTWMGEQHLGRTKTKTRVEVKTLSPTSYAMTVAVARDGREWLTVMEGKATKQK
jgi:hypothetical protein